MAIDPY